jgi:hypothetical protein
MDSRRILKHVRFLLSADTSGLNPEVCWNWTGATNSNGYGRFIDSNVHVLAHRASYQLFVSEIADGLNVCHACDNRLCVNPHHLWLGSQSENLRDAVAKGRHSTPDTNGERNGNRKLSAFDVERIRALYKGGQRKYRIAELYNVSPSTVGDIIEFRTWKDAA